MRGFYAVNPYTGNFFSKKNFRAKCIGLPRLRRSRLFSMVSMRVFYGVFTAYYKRIEQFLPRGARCPV